MRLLTALELEQVAGGTPTGLPGVIVTAPGGNPADWDPYGTGSGSPGGMYMVDYLSNGVVYQGSSDAAAHYQVEVIDGGVLTKTAPNGDQLYETRNDRGELTGVVVIGKGAVHDLPQEFPGYGWIGGGQMLADGYTFMAMAYPTSIDITVGSHLIHVQVSDPQQYLTALKAADALSDNLRRLDAAVGAVKDTDIIHFRDGSQITGAELKAIYNHTNWTMVDTNFGPFRAGENKTVNGVTTVTMNAASLITYNSTNNANNQNMNEIIFHELAHDTAAGLAKNTAMFRDYVTRTGDTTGASYAGSPEFIANEKYANGLAADIGLALKLPTYANPTYGF